jgi:hypothetical protein
VGHGYQGVEHHGLKHVTLEAMSRADFHDEPLQFVYGVTYCVLQFSITAGKYSKTKIVVYYYTIS